VRRRERAPRASRLWRSLDVPVGRLPRFGGPIPLQGLRPFRAADTDTTGALADAPLQGYAPLLDAVRQDGESEYQSQTDLACLQRVHRPVLTVDRAKAGGDFLLCRRASLQFALERNSITADPPGSRPTCTRTSAAFSRQIAAHGL